MQKCKNVKMQLETHVIHKARTGHLLPTLPCIAWLATLQGCLGGIVQAENEL